MRFVSPLSQFLSFYAYSGRRTCVQQTLLRKRAPCSRLLLHAVNMQDSPISEDPIESDLLLCLLNHRPYSLFTPT